MKKQENPIYNDSDILPKQVQVSLDVEQLREVEEVDRITVLPDDILLSIISLLTFREVTVTKILSSRWSRLDYTSNVIVLDFPFPLKQDKGHYGSYIQRAQENTLCNFVSRINHALDSYEGGERIDRFKIDIPCTHEAFSDYKKWLKFALSRNTGIIDMRMIYGLNSSFYSDLYLSLMAESTLPGLKYLKELSLSGFYFDSKEFSFTKFVALERLSIESPQTQKRSIRLGSVWKLKHLSIYNFAKVSYVSVYEMMSLVSLRIHGLESYDLCIKNVPKLVDLSIVKARLDRKSGFLRQIQSAAFAQLLRVRLCILITRNKVGECINHQLFPLLQACPSMEELEIKFLWSAEGISKYRRLEKDVMERNVAFDKLKTMRLSGYRGNVSVLEFVCYVTNNARNLKDFIVEDSDKNHAPQRRRKHLTRAFKKLRSAIPKSVNFISL